MGWKLTVDSYDPGTGRYRATGVVTDETGEHAYSVEGTWHDEDADMVAGAMVDQHAAALAAKSAGELVKARIVSLVEAAISKREA